MNDLISRQAAIEEIARRDTTDGTIKVFSGKEVAEILNSLPSAQQTLYGYKIEHLAYIAKVMVKEGVSAEYAVRTFDDMSRTMRMIIDEAQRKVEEAMNERFYQQTGGD